MPPTEIPPADERLPPLELPAGALDAGHPDYENRTGTDPAEIEPIEHRIRRDIIAAGGLPPSEQDGPGKSPARESIRETLVDTYEREQQFFPRHDDIDARLDEASAFLTDKLAPLYADIETVRDNRRDWYFDLIPENLDTIQSTLDSLTPVEQNTFYGVVIVGEEETPSEFAEAHGLESDDVLKESALDNHMMPSEYGIGLPAPLLVGEFISGSTYAFLPWADAVVCGCPYKQTNKWAVMCKHELAAANRVSANSEERGGETYKLPLDTGVQTPHRARRFVGPDNRHQ